MLKLWTLTFVCRWNISWRSSSFKNEKAQHFCCCIYHTLHLFQERTPSAKKTSLWRSIFLFGRVRRSHGKTWRILIGFHRCQAAADVCKRVDGSWGPEPRTPQGDSDKARSWPHRRSEDPRCQKGRHTSEGDQLHQRRRTHFRQAWVKYHANSYLTWYYKRML